jgi:hypothetical protein
MRNGVSGHRKEWRHYHGDRVHHEGDVLRCGGCVFSGAYKMKLGDTIKEVTESLGIKQCDSCKDRQAWLNGFGDTLMERINAVLQRKTEDAQVESQNPKR